MQMKTFLMKIFSLFSALKLPLCRVKNDFAQEHGITQKAPEPVRSRVPEPTPIRTRVQEPTPSFSPTSLPKRSQSSFTREGDTLIVTPSETIKENESPSRSPPLRSSLLDRLRNTQNNRGSANNDDSNDACKGKF